MNNKNNEQVQKMTEFVKKYLLPFLLLLSIGGGIYLTNKRLEKPVIIEKEKAAEVATQESSLSVSPTSISVMPGSSFTADFVINSNESITAADLTLTYNKDILIPSTITYGTFLPVILKPAVVNNGTITLTLGRKLTESKTGYGTLVSVKFTAIAHGSGIISYSNSQVAAIGKTANVINSVSYATVTVPTPTPTIIFTPIPTKIPTPTLQPTSIPSVTPKPTSTIIPTSIPIATSITSAPQTSTIVIYAAGTQADDQYPNMQLIINNQVEAMYYGVQGNPNTRTFVSYTYNATKKITHDMVKVRFINDGVNRNKNQDRNLMVDKIEIDGVSYESEKAYSTSTWTSRGGCSGGYKNSEWLHCSGEFRY